jgi:hypothetical protein
MRLITNQDFTTGTTGCSLSIHQIVLLDLILEPELEYTDWVTGCPINTQDQLLLQDHIIET